MVTADVGVESALNTEASWDQVRLGDVLHVEHGYAFEGMQFRAEGDDLPIVVTIGNFRYDGGFRFDETEVKRYEGNYPERFVLSPLDMLVAMTCQTPGGEILGLPAIIPDDGRKYLHNQRMGKVVIDEPALLDHRFCYWLFLSVPFNKYLYETSGGTKVKHTSPSRIEAHKTWLPLLLEQQKIAALLDAFEETLRAEAFLIESRVAAKAAVAEELLSGRRRFPGFTAPWRERRLGEFFAPKDDRAPTRDPMILSCSKVYGILPQSERFSKQLASVNNAHYKHIVQGDLVYDPMLLWDASIAFSSYEGIVSPAYETLAWTGEEKGDRRFFKALFKTDAMKYVYKTISQGTNARRRKAPVSDFQRVTLRLPDAQEQRRIADCLELLDEEIAILRRQRDLLNEQKKGLMHKLLTGEVRLKEFRS